MKVKKLFSILMCICIVFSLAACGNKPADEITEEIPELITNNLEVDVSNTEKSSVENTVEVSSELASTPVEYNMIELGNYENNGRNFYTFVVQVQPAPYDTYNMSVYDKEGNDISSFDYKGDINIHCFESSIITEDYKQELFKDFEEQIKKAGDDSEALDFGLKYPFIIDKDDCVYNYVYILDSSTPINMSDYTVKLRRSCLIGTDEDETVLSFKGTEDDLNLAPYYINGNGLVKLNDRYLILNEDSSGLGSTGNTAEYNIYSFYDAFDYSKGEKDISRYTEVPVEWYFGEDKVELKEGWSTYFKVEPESDGSISYHIGVTGPASDYEEFSAFVHKNDPCLITDNGPVILYN